MRDRNEREDEKNKSSVGVRWDRDRKKVEIVESPRKVSRMEGC